ncbi:MAG: SPOR domain-containing protein [Gemmatimonadaceae bacterium]
MPRPFVLQRPARPLFLLLPALALVSGACGRRDQGGELTKGTLTGPDPIVVRVALKGGKARAYRYPALDSAVWTSTANVPAVGELLAFDHENGVLAYADASGIPGWIDLRLGSVRPATRKRLTSVTTADGWSIYGVSGKSEIARFTPTGDWTLTAKGREISELLPQQNGTLLVLFENGEARSLVRRLRPPDARWLDSLELNRPRQIARTELGDRVYFAFGHDLVAINTGSMQQAASLRVEDEIVALAPTPSGDRVYLVTESDVVDVYDRYTADVVARVPLPGVVTELRMDATGRYVLARSALGDTTWIISTGSNRFLGGIEGQWRADLPAVGVDGAIASVHGSDVVFVDPTTLQEVGRTKGGAADAWFFMLWNGFRPRAVGIDQPVQFSWRGQDSLMAAALGDTGRIAFVGGAADSVARAAAQKAAPRIDSVRTPPIAVRTEWTVSFAVVLSEERARALATGIVVEGERAHVVSGRSAETQVYRVVLGPYPTRADAERVGRASGRQFWVYDGVP